MKKIKLALLLVALLLPIYSFAEVQKTPPLPENIKNALRVFLDIFFKIKNEYIVEPNSSALMTSCIKGMKLGEEGQYASVVTDSLKSTQDVARKMLDIIESKRSIFTDTELSQKIVECTEEMVENLDDASSYMEEGFRDNPDWNTQASIGISLKRENNQIMITPLERGSAKASGIRKSLLLEVDHKSVSGYRKSEVLKLLKGPWGTRVDLKIMPDGSSETKEITLDRVKLNSKKTILESEWYGGDYLYLKIPAFDANAGKELSLLMNETISIKKIAPKGIILDLRANPGGLLSESVAVSSIFLPKDELIVQITGRQAPINWKLKSNKADYIRGSTEPDFVENLPGWRTTLPLVVLIDGQSGGSSEIVAAALRDHHRGVLMGENTYGNGKLQTIYPMNNNRALKLTTAKYYTSLNQPIDIVGIKPDIELNESVERDADMKDKTILAAIKYLNDKKTH